MLRCRGVTKKGKRCRKNRMKENIYCNLHSYKATIYKATKQAINECASCFENVDEVLECGHYVHLSCVKKHADCMQDIRTNSGKPEIKYGICPVCRKEIKKVIAKKPEIKNLKSIEISISEETVNLAREEWVRDGENDQVLLQIMIWKKLKEKYQDQDDTVLYLISIMIERQITNLNA